MRARASRPLRKAVLGTSVVAVLLVGVGGWALTHRDKADHRGADFIGEPSPGAPAYLHLGGTLPSIASAASVGPVPGGGAADGRSAVDRYLQAEADGDTAASFLLLSSDDRAQHDSPVKWERDHADLPTIVAFRVGEVSGDAMRATVAVSLDLAPTLDLVTGNVPAHGDGVMVAVLEGDAWYVSLGDSAITARWPVDDGAAPAARAWASARQQCTTADEFTSLVGSPVLADPLCGSSGAIEIGAPEQLQPDDATAVVAAFGADSLDWARIVPVSGPVKLRAVLAPLGEEWIVVGVLTPST